MKWIVVVAIAVAACVDKGPGPEKRIDPSIVASHLLEAVPADIERLDVALDDKVVYLGNRVDKTVVAPGASVKVTHYWKVNKPIGPGWRVFATMRGGPNTPDFLNVPASEMELGHPVAAWKHDQIIEDVQDIVLRPDWRSKTATLLVGLIRVGKHDTLDRMRAEGAHTIDRAIIARQLEVDLSRAPPPLGTVYIPHCAQPIKIDGVAGEWTVAATSPEFPTGDGSSEPVGKATGRMCWDETNLYVFVSIVDTDVYSQYKTQDDPLWKQDTIEIFIDADGNKRGYVELQVNPNNATFDSWFAGPRAGKGDEEWDAGIVSAVKVRGTADVAGDADTGWDVEIQIPLVAAKGKDAAMPVRIPPEIGDRWKMNVVRVDKKSGEKSATTVSSWNRISYGDFHGLERMLTVVFADTSGSIVKSAVPAGAGSGDSGGSGVGSSVGSGSAGSGNGVGSGVGSGSGFGIRNGKGSGSGNGNGVGDGARVGSGSGIGSGSGGVGSGGSGVRLDGAGSANRVGSGSASANRVGSGSAAPSIVPTLQGSATVAPSRP